MRCGEQECAEKPVQVIDGKIENKHCQGPGLVSQKENLLRMGLGMKFVIDPEEGHLTG